MNTKIDKELILRQIKLHYHFQKDVDFAKFLGIKPQTLNTWYARNNFDFEIIYSKCVDISADWLITGKGSMLKEKKEYNVNEHSISQVAEDEVKYFKDIGLPLIPIDAMAGVGKGDDSSLYIDAERYFVPEFKNKADYLIRISGNSMAPKYYNGDVVACKRIPTQTFIQWGKVYILDTVQGALCKRLFEGNAPDMLKVVSDNEKYPPFEMSLKNDVRALAIVVGVIRLQ